MARQMSPERQREWEELRAFFIFWERQLFPSLMPLDDPGHPANAVDRIAEKFGVTKALQGLKQAIHDTVERYGNLAGDDLRRVDATLSANGLLTFSEVRRRYWSKYQKVLKRNAIRSETEYYLLKGISDDLTIQVPDEEREQIGALLAPHEHTEVPVEDMYWLGDSLPLLSPKAFRYYLPSFVAFCLTHPESSLNALMNYNLAPSAALDEGERPTPRWSARVGDKVPSPIRRSRGAQLNR